MSGKSPSGFADLRAKFESQSDVTPPPSRGRSPAGTESLSGGRKIRTSFISVERSGNMASSLDHEGSTSSAGVQKNTAVGEKEVKTEDEDGPKDLAATNQDQESALTSTNEPSNGTLELGKATATDAVNPDKPITAAEDDVPAMQPSDPKDGSAVSGGAALAPKGESLGALLKGSEFEPEQKGSPAKTSTSKKASKNPAAASTLSTPTRPSKGPEKSASTQLKARDSPKINGSPKPKPESAPPSKISKPQAPPAPQPPVTEPSTNESSAAEPPATEPPAIEPPATEPPATDPTSPAPEVPEPTVSEPTDVPTSAIETPAEGPKTPTSSTTTKEVHSRQSLQKTASPRQPLQPGNETQAVDKDHKKAIPEKPGRPSVVTRLSQPTTSSNGKIASSAASRVPKKPTVGSPNTNKPKPRSPTRPVRLPSSATAPTAASAARTGAESQNTTSDLSKPSISNKLTGSKGPSKPVQVNAPHPRARAPRSSLPASTIESKPKPKPRTSIASMKPAGSDFLARMMRPTQSSASKAHDKATEQQTPPKKRLSSRPKTLSDESNKETGNKPVTDEHAQENVESNGEEEKDGSNHSGPETDQGAIMPETIEENPAADTQHEDVSPLNYGAADPAPAQ
ncbi:MAG: hypothetical protein LQ352_002862 [Teloschistes flavicans]|nr:MAG: hypothetical protein LQ352_002862 [Teloschistes flavicans]